jgi:hypothetical protein
MSSSDSNIGIDMSSNINSNSRNLRIYGIVYRPGDKGTDFNTIKKTNPECKLFIYNENFFQFNDKSDVSPGGGNAFMRSFRQDNDDNMLKQEPKCKSLGIPTAVGEESMETVKDAIDQIYQYVDSNPTITEVYYSSTNDMKLGLGIFASEPFAKANIDEISNELVNTFKRFKDKYGDVKLLLVTGSNEFEEKEL